MRKNIICVWVIEDNLTQDLIYKHAKLRKSLWERTLDAQVKIFVAVFAYGLIYV